MTFEKIIGQDHIKKHLSTSTENGRIPHAQLFVGKEGSGTLAAGSCICKTIIM